MFQATLQANSESSKFAYGTTLLSSKLFLARLDGSNVSSRFLGATTATGTGKQGSRGPALATVGGTAHIAYRDGSSGSSGAPILAGPYNETGSSWSVAKVKVGSAEPGTDQPVGLSPFGGELYMAFKQGQHPIGIAWLSGGTWSWYGNAEHAIVNNANPKVAANGNSHGDAYVITSRAPSITNLSLGGTERLYLAFKENGGRGHVYFGSSSNPSAANSWSNLVRIGSDYLTHGAPAIAAWKGKVVLVFPNASDRNRIYSAIFDPAIGFWSELSVIKDGGTVLDIGNDKEAAATNITLAADATHNRLFLSYGQDGKAVLYYLTPAS